MSFEAEKLSVITLADLYKNTLVEISIPFFGNNKKKILILVNYDSSEFIPDHDLQLLNGILSACKLSLEDIALINLHHVTTRNHRELTRVFDPGTVILFGLTAESIELPVQFPHFQVQSYNKMSFLSSPELSMLESDKLIKSKLWLCLKQIFSL